MRGGTYSCKVLISKHHAKGTLNITWLDLTTILQLYFSGKSFIVC
jgi:hypothetical protein